MKKELPKLALKALATSDFKVFGDTLATQGLPDSFGVLADSDLASHIAEKLSEKDPTKWITREITWNTELYDPHVTLSPEDQLLHLLWQDLSTRLIRKLDAVARRTLLANRGAILCFFGRAHFSIIIEYKRSYAGAMSLRPLAAVYEPNGVFELTNLLDGATAEVGNAIKNVAFSVDKLVFQRGCIIHVDRQKEDVFGPTIDTVILGELLAEWLEASSPDRKISTLEIGPGNGLLSAILASSDRVSELIAVDLNMAAVTCTLKNLHINDANLDAKHQQVRVRAERFEANQFTSPFDFVICNPPYIPGAPDSASPSMREYGRAVGGLGLCIEVLKSLPMLLSSDGVLLLMASSLSDDEVIESVPEEFEIVAALGSDGRRVPLDVDVVWQRPDWRDWLLANQKIEQDDNGKLWHRLRPLWIKHRQ